MLDRKFRARNACRFFAQLALPLFCLSLFSPKVHALPPDIQWEQIETEHFVIIYDSKHKELGALYAKSAEQAWAAASPTFGLWPSKTAVLVDDTTDVANGSATGIPYPIINAYPVLPATQDNVSDYGNWSLELLTHEYTHVLNFEPATGIMKPLRWIFGSIVRPNILLPRWYSEGLAVEMETRLSGYGRLRSPNYLAVVRSMVEENTLRQEDISRVNEVSIPGWPGGIRPYLLGAMIWDTMVRKKGPSIIGDLNLAYSRRVPYFINGPVEDRLGLNYQQILNETYQRAEDIVKKQLVAIRAGEQPTEMPLREEGFDSHGLVYSPDGSRLAWASKRHNGESIRTALRDQAPTTSESHARDLPPPTEAEGGLINRISWFPDSKRIVYDLVNTFERYYEYSDLYELDTETQKSKQLTHGLRAREPVVSPNGKQIVFIQNLPASTQLAAVSADGADYTVWYTPPGQTRLSNPEFVSPNELLFSEKRDDGIENFKILKLKTVNEKLAPASLELRTVLADFRPVHYPRMTRFGLLFVSDRSGVANAYLANKDLKGARPVTNTNTQILTIDLDPKTNDLVYSRLESDGPHIYFSPRDSWTAFSKKHASLPQVSPLIDAEWPEHRTPEVTVNAKPEPYRPFGYLLPRFWIPYVYVAPGVSYFSATTNASDPAGRHSYSITASYDTLAKAPSFFGSYVNKTTPVEMTFTALSVNQTVGGLRRADTAAAASGAFYLPKLSNHWNANVGWDFADMTVDPFSLKRSGPQVGLAYKNVHQRGYEISPEKGGMFDLIYTRYLPTLSDQEYEVVSAGAAKFLSGWILPERHVLALFLNSSIAPRLGNAIFGVTTTGGNYQLLPGLHGFVMRGYNNGAFIARNMIQATAEYRFPLLYSYRGYRTVPIFLQRWHGDIFADALTLDGASYDLNANSYIRQKLGLPFYGVGGELKLDVTVAYHIPAQIIFGLYYGLDPQANPNGVFPVVSLGL